jgi:hypothetical protein
VCEAASNSEYEIQWIPRLPGQLHTGDYFKAVDDQGRSFEGVVVGTPWMKKFSPTQLWNIYYSPSPGLTTSGVADSQKVMWGTVRRKS